MSQRKSKKMAARRAKRRRQSQMRLMLGISMSAVVVAAVIVLLSLASNTTKASGNYEELYQEIDLSGAWAVAIGDPNAPVTLLEYSDFSCSHCKNLAGTTGELINEYARDGHLRVVYKPLSFLSEYSVAPAMAVVCAAEQGVGWQMIDRNWEISSPALYSISYFTDLDGDVVLDAALFEQCYESPDTAQSVQDVVDEAVAMGINATPTVFVNGEPFMMTVNYAEDLRQSIETALGN
ncbi:MAG: DsbA family protein [Anaerolineae bacterium]|nr:DsbA family protein [Anaerolineae bacterium]